MARRKGPPLSRREVPEVVAAKMRPPLVVVLGSPAEVVNLLEAAPDLSPTCFQLDVFQAERLRAELVERGLKADVVVHPDLWDLPAEFQTAVYLPARGGERELKLDMVEQAFHVLRHRGNLVVWSPHPRDALFGPVLKKVFGKAHLHADAPDTIIWASREGDRSRRRHEMTFQARVNDSPSCRFVTRPGVFSYGRFDEGSRALAEGTFVEPGMRVVDLGCGCGTNGVFAGLLAGPEGHVTFVDSNARAVTLANLNARANGLTAFETVLTADAAGLPSGTFDVALANPPYFANHAVARLFIERAKSLLKPEGLFYLVTKQPHEVVEFLVEVFGEADAEERRGYTILIAGGPPEVSQE